MLRVYGIETHRRSVGSSGHTFQQASARRCSIRHAGFEPLLAETQSAHSLRTLAHHENRRAASNSRAFHMLRRAREVAHGPSIRERTCRETLLEDVVRIPTYPQGSLLTHAIELGGLLLAWGACSTPAVSGRH